MELIITKNSIPIGKGKLLDRTRDNLQFITVRIDDIVEPKNFKFEIQGEEGLWEFKSWPVMYQTDGITIVSTYGPASPIPDGLVEIQRI